MLLEHDDTHTLQHRQQSAQRGPVPTQIPGQLGRPLVTFGDRQLDRIIGQLFDDGDIVDGLTGGDGLLIHLGKSRRIVRGGTLPDGAGLRSVQEPVGPRPGGFGQQRLDPVRLLSEVSTAGKSRPSRRRTVKWTSAHGASLTRAVYSTLEPPNSRIRMSCIANRTVVV